MRRNRKILVISFLLILAALLGTVGLREFNQRYPNQGLLSAERLADSAAILLGTDMRLSKFQPRSMLVIEREKVIRTAYPAIDIHFHLESLPPDITPARLVQGMEATGIAKVVNLGGLPNVFERFASTFYDRYPEHIVLFAKPDMNAIRRNGGIEEQVRWLQQAARRGARGLKVSKSFGLGLKDASGKYVPVDDHRLDPIWNEAARLGLPVLIHTSDPPAFFMKADARNEHYEEMAKFPQWARTKPGTPQHADLMAQRERLLARHPNTVFIGAHMGSNSDDLGYVGKMLDRFPNYYVDMSSVVHTLGRQPFTARKFFIKYQDRILFGTDGGYAMQNSGAGWTPERVFRSYIEFLETSNEYIDYPLWDVSAQGRWRVYGIDLPDDVLKKIYSLNAERLLPTAESIATRLAAR